MRLTIELPSSHRTVKLDLPMLRCSDDPSSFQSDPQQCVSADAFEPRSWFNGCASLHDVAETTARLELDLSWSGPGYRGECKENTSIPLYGEFRKDMACGVMIEGEFRLGGERSNNGVNLPVRPVTALANCASAAPVRPAGYAGR